MALILCLLPAAAGYAIGLYFHYRALDHLRTPLPPRWRAVRGVLTLFFTPQLGSRYTLDGLRYRGYALACAIGGAILTTLLIVAVNPRS